MPSDERLSQMGKGLSVLTRIDHGMVTLARRVSLTVRGFSTG